MRISDWSSDVCSSDLTTVCQEDLTQNYGVITPEIERFGFSGRVTAKIGDSSEAYGELNFLQTEVSYDGLPSTIRGNAPAPFYFPRYSTSSNIAYYGDNTILQLPVYVCPRETQDRKSTRLNSSH